MNTITKLIMTTIKGLIISLIVLSTFIGMMYIADKADFDKMPDSEIEELYYAIPDIIYEDIILKLEDNATQREIVEEYLRKPSYYLLLIED